MKLRIKGDSLRLRVSRSELARLLGGERVEDTVHFAPIPDARLTYALESASQADPVRIQYEPQNVTVFLSEEQAEFWAKDSEVGIYTSINIGPARSLEIIVEKDFACLDRSEEENADTFVNPLVGATC
ncbi:DUF7009 family protein [Edaphobacter aggregans]|uniref:DUF7009 family protein n=1 Tax=Edaphobacter aggregans TaxID=570835 RepID=UPI00054E77D2|nr:hypothetical protein [Edaphobacter aggregans]